MSKIQFFDNPSSFLVESLKDKETRKIVTGQLKDEAHKKEWANGATFASLPQLLNDGSSVSTDAVFSELSRIESQPVTMQMPYWEIEAAGAFPCVPAFVAGDPECMFNLNKRTDEGIPLRVFVSLACSSGVTAKQLQARGAAVLALVRQLSIVRPVELYASVEGNGSQGNDGRTGAAVALIKIDTSPLDVPTAAFIFADSAFYRGLGFAWMYQHGFQGGWPWSIYPDKDGEKDYAKRYRDEVGATEQDLILPPATLNSLHTKNPTLWLEQTIAAYNQ